jgi:phosphomevalonate kinase
VIEALAPGKVVLWGEYAVLTGAPALVMAVNHYAACRIAPHHAGWWSFESLGHPAPAERISREQLLSAESPPPHSAWHTCWQVLQRISGPLPVGGSVRLDTRSFHHAGSKIGLGSSAAVCVAAYGAFSRLLGQSPTYPEAMAMHRDLQGGEGSGIDVAAAWHGGMLKFQRTGSGAGTANPWHPPVDLHTTFVWTGRPARTTDHLARFRDWLERGSLAPLTALEAAASALFEAADPWRRLPEYVAALEALDEAAELGIFSPAHTRLRALAIDAGVVYKPCGAGGGDLGASFTRDPDAAERFARTAAADGFLLVPLETASHGLEVTG